LSKNFPTYKLFRTAARSNSHVWAATSPESNRILLWTRRTSAL